MARIKGSLLSGTALTNSDNEQEWIQRFQAVDSAGNPTGNAATAGTDLSGTATTTSGGLNIPADATRKPGDVQGQNVSGVNIGFNEFNGTAAIGSAGTYTVPAGGTFSITTNRQVNFVAASGTAAVTITKNG